MRSSIMVNTGLCCFTCCAFVLFSRAPSTAFPSVFFFCFPDSSAVPETEIPAAKPGSALPFFCFFACTASSADNIAASSGTASVSACASIEPLSCLFVPDSSAFFTSIPSSEVSSASASKSSSAASASRASVSASFCICASFCFPPFVFKRDSVVCTASFFLRPVCSAAS